MMRKKTIFVVSSLIGVYLVIRWFSLTDYLTFQNIRNHATTFKTLADRQYFLTVLAYIPLYTVVTGLSIPGAVPLTLLAGFLFGVFPATIYVNIGATLGATSAFLITRYVAGTHIQETYTHKFEGFNRNLDENGIRYLLALRLVPVFPFFLINIFAGLTKISTSTFIWTTSLGILPGTIAYTFVGRQLQDIYKPQDILSGRILIALIILALFLLLPTILKMFKIKLNTKEITKN